MSAFDVIIFVHVIAVIVGFFTIVILYVQKPSLYQSILVATALCSFVGLLSYLLELLSKNLEEALLAARFGYVGKSYAMVLFLFFIAKYCDVYIPKAAAVGLMIFSTGILTAVLSTPYHKLYYSTIEFVEGKYFWHLVLGKGIVYYIFMAVTLLIMLSFITISFTALIRRKGKDRRRLMLLCLSVVLPAVGLIFNLFPFLEGFDPTPMGIFLATLLVSLNVLRYGLLDTMQLASENVMDNSGGALIVVNNSKKFIYANKKAFEILPELKDTEQSKKILYDLFKDINSNYVDSDEHNKVHSNIYSKNNVIYQLNYSVLKENSRKNASGTNGYMVWMFDKTKDYEYTKELERLRLEAEEANNAKSLFLARMSHEIRTPMNGIMGFADLTLENELDKESKEYVSYIKESANSLLGIINDVLDISKIESGKMQIVEVEYNPNELFGDVITLISAQAETKGLFFSTYITDELPGLLIGDRTRLREILINVLGNAVKYTKRGGIVFKVSVVKKEEENLTLEMHVIDSGIGIKKESMENIFDTFEQADAAENYQVEGTGLGLSIARQLAELMGGRITVNSTYGKGSDFCIVLPQRYVMKYEEIKNKIETHNIKYTANDIKALVVDDNIINLKVEKGLLERYNMQVYLAESGKDCIELCKKEKFDIIFMDHMMPDMDGVETLHNLRNQQNLNKNTPVVLVTANAIVGVEESMLQEGFDGFISKPIDTKLLEEKLKEVFTSEKFGETGEDIDKKSASIEKLFGEDELKKTLADVGVSVDTGIKYCGDFESYISILEIAAAGYEEKTRKIAEYKNYNDIENYTITVHSLKSGAANIGAESLSEKARMLEMAGHDKDMETIKNETDNLLDQYKQIIETIKKCLELSEKTPEKQDKDKIMEPDSWNEYLEKIGMLLDELEIDDVEEVLADIETYKLTSETENLLESMREYISSFDVEGAKAILNALHGIQAVE